MPTFCLVVAALLVIPARRGEPFSKDRQSFNDDYIAQDTIGVIARMASSSRATMSQRAIIKKAEWGSTRCLGWFLPIHSGGWKAHGFSVVGGEWGRRLTWSLATQPAPVAANDERGAQRGREGMEVRCSK